MNLLKTRRSFVAICALALIPNIVSAATLFFQTNLTSNVPGLAANLDPLLKNPWGMSFAPGSPFWVSDQGTGSSTLYNAAGLPQPQPTRLIVSIPQRPGPPGPTGQVFNSSGTFTVTGTASTAVFLFSTLSGTIAGWNLSLTPPTSAVTLFTAPPGTVYTGLAAGSIGPAAFLYAADFANNKIDVVDSTFKLTSLAGSFSF